MPPENYKNEELNPLGYIIEEAKSILGYDYDENKVFGFSSAVLGNTNVLCNSYPDAKVIYNNWKFSDDN